MRATSSPASHRPAPVLAADRPENRPEWCGWCGENLNDGSHIYCDPKETT